MERIINTGEFKIIISCNEIINHFLHTLNIYGLLGNHGTQYPLKNNSLAKNSIVHDIFMPVQQGDQYFSYGGLNIFKTGMKHILDNSLWKYPVDENNSHLNITEADFGTALTKSWDGFYKNYWKEAYESTKDNFFKCINAFNFEKSLEKMTFATHKMLPKDFYVFSSDALKYSAITYGDNVCMGVAEAGEDIGFVHEGLHLLLNEEWANNSAINRIITEHGYKDNLDNSWKTKYEQALVISLDCRIQNYDDNHAAKYFGWCGVSDLYEIVYPIVRDYYNGGCSDTVENIMLQIFKSSYKI